MVVARTALALVVVKVAPALIVIELIVEAVLTSSVTVQPPSIVTMSPDAGTDAPEPPPEVSDQVVVELQFPLATE
jgi:hypothetical protein